MNTSVDYLRVIFALLFVIGLLALLNFALRRYGHHFGIAAVANRGRNRRLQLVEILPLDPRNKVVIIRRDNIEHLVLVGQNNCQVIEQNLPSQADVVTQ